MVGEKESIDFEDALGIASFLVAAGRVPAPAVWVDALRIRGQDAVNEGWSENFF